MNLDHVIWEGTLESMKKWLQRTMRTDTRHWRAKLNILFIALQAKDRLEENTREFRKTRFTIKKKKKKLWKLIRWLCVSEKHTITRKASLTDAHDRHFHYQKIGSKKLYITCHVGRASVILRNGRQTWGYNLSF